MTRQLIELRQEGISNAEIAATLGVNKSRLEAQISLLIKRGAIPSRNGLLWSHPDAHVHGRERTRHMLAPDLARLYRQGQTHRQIALALKLTEHQVHNQLTQLFAAGLPKRKPQNLTDEQVRSIHNAYLAGGSIGKLARQHGFSGTSVRERLDKLGLNPAKRLAARTERLPAGTPSESR